MNRKQNIGVVNALLRISFGLTFLAWATAKLVKKPWKDSYLIIAFLSAMKVGEGILKYCPMTDMIQNQAKNMTDSDNKPQLKQMIDMFTPKQMKQSQNEDAGSSQQQGQEKNGGSHSQNQGTNEKSTNQYHSNNENSKDGQR